MKGRIKATSLHLNPTNKPLAFHSEYDTAKRSRLLIQQIQQTLQDTRNCNMSKAAVNKRRSRELTTQNSFDRSKRISRKRNNRAKRGSNECDGQSEQDEPTGTVNIFCGSPKRSRYLHGLKGGPIDPCVTTLSSLLTVASLGWVTPGAATEGVTHLFFSLKTWRPFFAHRCHYHYRFLLLSLGCHPLQGVTPHLFTCPNSFLHCSL